MRFPLKFVAPVLVLSLICVAAPKSFATSHTEFSNGRGTLTGTDAGLTLSGSVLIGVSGFEKLGLVAGNLGTVAFTTGALTVGSLQMGGSFAAGGTFTITGDGKEGIPSGVLFTGSFTSPLTWSLTTLSNGTHNYMLSGVVTGMMGGVEMSGVTVQLTVNTGRGFFDGSTRISGGDTSVSTAVPEPSTLALFGVGALSFLGMVRLKRLEFRS